MNREFRAGKRLATGTSTKCFVLVLVLFVLSPISVSLGFAQSVIDGGLTAPAVGGTLGPNILTNGNFSAGTAGWTNLGACFAIDPTTLAPNGAATLEMSLSTTCATPIAVSSKVPSGATYTFSGQIMTNNVSVLDNSQRRRLRGPLLRLQLSHSQGHYRLADLPKSAHRHTWELQGPT